MNARFHNIRNAAATSSPPFADAGNAMRYLACCLTLAFVAVGCGRTGPLDDASIDVLSRTGMDGAFVEFPDGYHASLAPADYDMMRDLIASLAPVDTATSGALPAYDYRLTYIAGMDPAVIDVIVDGDEPLTYAWGSYVYVGGDAQRFRNGVDAIRERVESQRGEGFDQNPDITLGGEQRNARERLPTPGMNTLRIPAAP